MFELKPDFEDVLGRFEAWWDGAIVDRPPVSVTVPVPESERVPVPQKTHACHRDRWMDTEFIVAQTVARLNNTLHLGESLPSVYPNLGPEVFSAFYGCDMEYGERTAWSKPILSDWSDASVDNLQLDRNGFYYRKLLEMTEALLEVGKGKFIVGYTDLHGGGDAIAAFRDPQELLIDTIENPDAVKRLCNRVTTEFLAVYDEFHDVLSAAGMPSTTWMNATCKGRYHVPSNDFSCMISDKAFEDLFLPGIIRECRHMDRNIYHLDGPQALRYLNTLLAIPEIHAIQWVPGAGQDYWGDWIDVYQRIQDQGKSLVIGGCSVDDLPKLRSALRPEGVWLNGLWGVTSRAHAEAVLQELTAWTGRE